MAARAVCPGVSSPCRHRLWRPCLARGCGPWAASCQSPSCSNPSHWRQRRKPGLFKEQDERKKSQATDRETDLAPSLWQIVLSVCGVSWGLGDSEPVSGAGRPFAKLQAGWQPGRVGSGHLRLRGCPPPHGPRCLALEPSSLRNSLVTFTV
uniref:Uncharacterized protein n=1 Tax=Myotis myotis TaxID=51298 RepID=A0A7J7TTK2_MYOMY|nr:hypothetical protein mMyoMyo1_008919 [Myotis myotis]